MTTAAHIFLWIAAIAGGLGTLAGLVLAYMCIRWSRGKSDKRWGVVLGTFALGQNAIPVAGFALAAHGRAGLALAIGLTWAVLSILFLAIWPTLVSAAAQP